MGGNLGDLSHQTKKVKRCKKCEIVEEGIKRLNGGGWSSGFLIKMSIRSNPISYYKVTHNMLYLDGNGYTHLKMKQKIKVTILKVVVSLKRFATFCQLNCNLYKNKYLCFHISPNWERN